jgi:BirA family transcriptional regulator, biotin operon repressor / biotin---[acetyl-CoA-carboxylase] ligase
MVTLKIDNPFNAPVYHEDTVTSTMAVSRQLALEGSVHGTVIMADFQSAGRGRIQNRTWEMERSLSLPFTLLLRFSAIEKIPSALTLRAGLAASLAIEDFAPSLRGSVFVKWPNDIMIGSKKVAGILCEADGGNVHLGIGINVAQKEFPLHLKEKAASIALSSGMHLTPNDRFILLEKLLRSLYDELGAVPNGKDDWKSRLEQRLFKKGEQVIFIDGVADSGNEVRGTLVGIGQCGELLITPDGETNARSFITGELIVRNK